MTTTQMFRVLLVDDHPVVRHGMRSAFERQANFTIVGEAEDADDAISAVEMLKPDLLMLDIRIKGGRSGIEVASALKSRDPNMKIVVLTNHAQEPYLQAMIEAGVDGYLLKDTPPSELIKVIQRVIGGEKVFAGSIEDALARSYVKDEATGHPTSIEAEVLQLVADGLPNQVIASELSIDQQTVQVHLARTFAKLGVKNRDEAVARAAEQGYITIDGAGA